MIQSVPNTHQEKSKLDLEEDICDTNELIRAHSQRSIAGNTIFITLKHLNDTTSIYNPKSEFKSMLKLVHGHLNYRTTKRALSLKLLFKSNNIMV